VVLLQATALQFGQSRMLRQQATDGSPPQGWVSGEHWGAQ
jgi:hypothetical protein